MAESLKLSVLSGAGGNPRAGRVLRRALGKFPLLVLLVVGLIVFLKLAAGIHPTVPLQGAGPGVLRYRLIGSPGYSETDLRTIQTWILERRFKALPGVLNVTAQAEGGAIAGSVLLNGDRRAVEIEVDKLNQSGILPPGVRLETVQTRSVKRSNQPERAADSPGR